MDVNIIYPIYTPISQLTLWLVVRKRWVLNLY